VPSPALALVSDAEEQHIAASKPTPRHPVSTLTGPNTIAEHRQRKPGTSIGKLVLLSDMIPTTTCAEKIQLSVTPMMTTVHSETLANVDGVRVTSIWRTSKTSTSSCAAVANAASVSQRGLVEREQAISHLQFSDLAQKPSIVTPFPPSSPNAHPH